MSELIASLNYNQLASRRYTGLVLNGLFSGIAPEWELNWGAIQPTEGSFNWGPMDQIVEWALKNGLTVEGHALVWPTTNRGMFPAWVADGTWTSATLQAALETHIAAVVGRYKSVIHRWRVANEVFDDAGAGARRSNVFEATIGASWVQAAFQAAKNADASAELMLNDYGCEWGSYGGNAKFDALKALASTLKTAGLLDSVGLQCHMDLQYDIPNAADFPNIVTTFNALGIAVHATELDGRVDNVVDTPANLLTRQAAQFQTVRDAINAGAPAGQVCLWGLSDADNWLGQSAAAAPWDASYAPKPAADALGYAGWDFVGKLETGEEPVSQGGADSGSASAKVGDMAIAYDPSLLPAGTWLPADGTPISPADQPDLYAFATAHPALYPEADKSTVIFTALGALPGTTAGDYSYAAEFSPDGNTLVAALSDDTNKRILIWSVSGTTFTLKGTYPTAKLVTGFQFSDDGKYFTTTSGALYMFNVANLDNIHQYTLPTELANADASASQEAYGVLVFEGGKQHLWAALYNGASSSFVSYMIDPALGADPFVANLAPISLADSIEYGKMVRSPDGLIFLQTENSTRIYKVVGTDLVPVANTAEYSSVIAATFAPDSTYYFVPSFTNSLGDNKKAGGLLPVTRTGSVIAVDASQLDASNYIMGSTIYSAAFYDDNLLLAVAAVGSLNRLQARRFNPKTKQLTYMSVSPSITDKVLYSISCSKTNGLIAITGYTNVSTGLEVYQKMPSSFRAIPNLPGPYYIKAAD